MSTYYVRKTGSDASAGTSSGAAWLTFGKAASVVAAGDTVWFGAGVHRGNFQLSTSGSSGSTIKWRADIDGTQTGDAGLVLLTALTSDVSQGGTGSTLDLNGKEYNEFYGFVFGAGGSGASDYTIKAITGNVTYQGILFNGCSFLPPLREANPTINLNYNTGAAFTGPAPKIENSYIGGGINTTYGTFTANRACGLNVINCVIEAIGYGPSIFLVNIDGPDSTPGFGPTGYLFQNNVFKGSASSNSLGLFAAGDQWAGGTIGSLYNNTFLTNYAASNMGFYTDSGTWTGDGNKTTATALVTGSGAANYTTGRGDQVNCFMLFGHQVNHIFQSRLGWSPFSDWEHVRSGTVISGGLNGGDSDNAPSTDMLGNPRTSGRDGYISAIYQFDASDNAVTDPNAVWTSESNIVDGDTASIGYTAATGSASSNYAFAGGTNAPARDEAIIAVYARSLGFRNGSAVGKVAIYTDGLAELLGTISYSNNSPAAYTSWVALTPPTGGWTAWSQVQALEFKTWIETDGSNTGVYMIEVGVLFRSTDAGPVQARNRPARSTTSVHGGTYSAEFSGAGYQEFFRPVTAASTTITVYARFDSNYVGSKPKLEVFNIPGVADQSDTMTSGANTDEQLSVTFTPTAAGVVRVRISSQDTSVTGVAYFDDMA